MPDSPASAPPAAGQPEPATRSPVPASANPDGRAGETVRLNVAARDLRVGDRCSSGAVVTSAPVALLPQWPGQRPKVALGVSWNGKPPVRAEWSAGTMIAVERDAPSAASCAWPNCGKPALCQSGNFRNRLVCRDHFDLTNGGGHELEVLRADGELVWHLARRLAWALGIGRSTMRRIGSGGAVAALDDDYGHGEALDDAREVGLLAYPRP